VISGLLPHLASRWAPVLLDNGHLPGACAEAAAALLEAAREIVVLAAGRAAPRVGGETEWRGRPAFCRSGRRSEDDAEVVKAMVTG
jgi:predicted ATPase